MARAASSPAHCTRAASAVAPGRRDRFLFGGSRAAPLHPCAPDQPGTLGVKLPFPICYLMTPEETLYGRLKAGGA